jgi:two-component system cell cycle sensor histidine kinase/response regulator CckA
VRPDLVHLLPFLASAAVSAAVGVLCWRRRFRPGARAFAVYALSQAACTAAYAMEVHARTLAGKLFWDSVQYVTLLPVPVALLGFALAYTGRRPSRPAVAMAVLAAPLVPYAALAMAAPTHPLVRTAPRLVPGGLYGDLLYGFTPALMGWAAYVLALGIVALFLLTAEWIQAHPLYRTQAALVQMGVLLPWIGAVATVTVLRESPTRDVTPLTFAAGNLLIGWGLARRRLFDVVPVARDAVVESLADRVYVLDAGGRVVDLNPAARAALPPDAPDPVGRLAEDVLPVAPEALPGEGERAEAPLEGAGDAWRHAEVTVHPLAGAGDTRGGRVVVLRDITARRRVEAALRESHARFDRLVANVPGIVYSFRLDAEGRPSFPYVSGAVRHILQIGPAEAEADAMAVLQRVHPDEAEAFWASIRRSAEAMEPWEWRGRMMAGDGEMRWIQAQARPQPMDDGSILWDGLAVDVTDAMATEEALRESEERLRQMAEGVAAVLYVVELHPERRFGYVSPGYETVYGRSLDELHRNPTGWVDAIHPDDRDRVRRAVAAREGTEVEYRVVHPSGEVRWVQDRRILMGEDGRLRHAGVVVDVTARRLAEDALRASHDQMEERVRARTAELNAANETLRAEVEARARSEAALRAQEARFRAVVENVGEGLLLTDRADVVVYANPQVEAVTGYAPAELQGRVLHEVLYREGDPGWVADGEPGPDGTGRWQVPFTRKDGSRGWMAMIGSPMRGEDGSVTGVLMAVTDVTERRRAQQELRAVQERLRLLVETVRDYAMVVLDPGGVVVSWNAGAERTAGYTAEEIVGRHVSIFYPPESDGPELHLEEAAAEGRCEMEGWRVRRDGSRYYANTVLTALRDEAGTLVGFAAITRDLTDRKAAEEALRASEEQLRQSQKMEAVGRLAGGIAHDFNNILMAISGHTQLLMRRADVGEGARPGLEEVKRGADRAAALTRQLLAFSRRQVLQPRVLELPRVVAEMQGMLSPLLRDDVELVLRLDPATPRVRADATQMEQVVMNLVVNSRDAMPDGGVIVVEVEEVRVGAEEVRRHPFLRPGRYVCLGVTDTGSGLDEETKALAFEPFFTTKGAGAGTGLGLSTVYGIVKQSDGWITVDSEPGVATSFRIYLPPVEEAAEEEAAPLPSVEPAAAAAGRRGETVLLVEDESAVRALLAEVLRDAGYRVLTARGGPEALLLADRHRDRVDLLLTDVVMPGMRGGELARRLRALHPEARVLFMSGHADEEVRRGLEGGDLLQKPVPPDEVVRRVRETLDRADAPAARV